MEIMKESSTEMGAESSGENTPKFILPICPIGPKIWDTVEKRLHWASVVSEEEPWFSFWTKSLA